MMSYEIADRRSCVSLPNKGMEPTPSSVRSCVAPASGRSSCLALGAVNDPTVCCHRQNQCTGRKLRYKETLPCFQPRRKSDAFLNSSPTMHPWRTFSITFTCARRFCAGSKTSRRVVRSQKRNSRQGCQSGSNRKVDGNCHTGSGRGRGVHRKRFSLLCRSTCARDPGCSPVAEDFCRAWAGGAGNRCTGYSRTLHWELQTHLSGHG